ncbi:M23 family metallopeptidase [Streptomyces beigongshangae]|uniref:M23 family metallopeptidase n=1 Tax=Streptomyces beigongshangae TaxID=2841597 RepID=UPI0027E1F06E|nr:M23 family metallopeptidase [Streptomyces sp. REN17]
MIDDRPDETDTDTRSGPDETDTRSGGNGATAHPPGDSTAPATGVPAAGPRAAADGGPDTGGPEPSSAPGPEARRVRRRPGPFTLLVLPGLLALMGVAGFLAATGGLSSAWPQGSEPAPAATTRVDASYVPWLRKAVSDCPVVEPSVLAAQIERLSGWSNDAGTLSGEKGIAAFTDARWRTWGKDDDGNGRSSPRDPADAMMALGRQNCSLAEKVTDLRTEGIVTGDLVDLTLAAYASGVDAVVGAGRVPGAAEAYVSEIRSLSERYRPVDRESSGGAVNQVPGAVLAAPAGTLTVTSPFGSRRHPLTGVTKLHTGIDFASPQGSQVSAASKGRVVFAATTAAYGNRVVVDHGTIDGRRLETTYSHLLSLQVSAGQSVDVGTPVGLVGSTGLSTGPHLHFEVVLDGHYTDPLPWLDPGT